MALLTLGCQEQGTRTAFTSAHEIEQAAAEEMLHGRSAEMTGGVTYADPAWGVIRAG